MTKQSRGLLKRSKPDFLHHNKVSLIQGGHSYFELLEEMIDDAAETIHLQTYIYDEDETGTTIANALIRAAKRNVKVFMLVDSYGSQALSGAFVEKLTEAGISFGTFQPMFKTKRFYLGRRLHHKVVVIDSMRCTVGGLNISNRYNDTAEGEAWLDWALYAEGEVALALEEVCISRLKHRPKKTSGAPLKVPNVCNVGVRVNDWVRRKHQIYGTYLRLFREANHELLIMSAYFLPGRRFRKNIEKAAKRGVKIKVVLTGSADVYLIKYAERYIYRWLFKNNIEVYEYRKNVLHAKIAVCDNRMMTVGSFNVNNLSAYGSIELNLEVENNHFAHHVRDRLEAIIRKDCIHVTEKDFNSQFNLLARAAHRWAYETFRFLFFLSTKKGG
jgi:cardiolipin synthase A/B